MKLITKKVGLSLDGSRIMEIIPIPAAPIPVGPIYPDSQNQKKIKQILVKITSGTLRYSNLFLNLDK
tara:strand:+ start:286 stop:486 length:201 start_codon:yes stop_codon:yes gene_type:complete